MENVIAYDYKLGMRCKCTLLAKVTLSSHRLERLAKAKNGFTSDPPVSTLIHYSVYSLFRPA